MFKIFSTLNASKRFKYHFISPLHFAIGTAAEQISVALRFADLQKKKLIILSPYKFLKFEFRVCNNYLFKKLISKNIKKNTDMVSFFFNFIFNIYLLYLALINFFLISKIEYPNLGLSLELLHKNDKIESDDHDYDFSKQSIFLVKNDENIFFNNLSNHTNYKAQQKIITIHFRDSYYRNDANRSTYRNSSIQNSYKSINYLLEKGYFVIRVGNIAEEKFEINHNNFFDYSFSKMVSNKNDLFLIKNSCFYIGTNSGLTEVAYLFNVPVLLHNMNLLFEGYPRKKCDRGILKKIYFGDENKELNLFEFMNLPYDYHHSLMHNTELISKINFEENSEDQIFQAVREYEYLYSNNSLNQHTLEQDELNRLLIKKINEIYKYNIEKIHKTKMVEKKDLDEPYKNLRYKNFLNGAISNIYLINQKKNEKKKI